jgi:hypothetical protein
MKYSASPFIEVVLSLLAILPQVSCSPRTTAIINSNTPTPALSPVPSNMPLASPAVPADYQPLYTELDSELPHFERTLSQSQYYVAGQPTFAAELAYANGNVGDALLNPNSLSNNRILLDRFQAIGVKGVVIAIKFPLLKPDFPRSSEYIQFWV